MCLIKILIFALAACLPAWVGGWLSPACLPARPPACLPVRVACCLADLAVALAGCLAGTQHHSTKAPANFFPAAHRHHTQHPAPSSQHRLRRNTFCAVSFLRLPFLLHTADDQPFAPIHRRKLREPPAQRAAGKPMNCPMQATRQLQRYRALTDFRLG